MADQATKTSAIDLKAFAGKTVVITGGTGSFGTTMARFLGAAGVGEVRVFSRDEAKQDQMRQKYADLPMQYYLGDVRDAGSIRRAVRGADMLFHAAALKQVPSCEFFPMEAVKTNVEGSDNVIRESIRAGLSSVVALSTDKAVAPINAMGMSKAMMEKIAIAAARSGAGDTGHLGRAVRQRADVPWLGGPAVSVHKSKRASRSP